MDVSSDGGGAGAVEGSARFCQAVGFRAGMYRRGRQQPDDLFHGRCAARADESIDGDWPLTEHDDDGDGCARR